MPLKKERKNRTGTCERKWNEAVRGDLATGPLWEAAGLPKSTFEAPGFSQPSGHWNLRTESWPSSIFTPGSPWGFAFWVVSFILSCFHRLERKTERKSLGRAPINNTNLQVSTWKFWGCSSDSVSSILSWVVENPTYSRVVFCANRRAYALESSLQSISSNLALWKRTNWSVVVQTWSWHGKPAASTWAGLQEENAECWHFVFPYEFGMCF